MEIVRHGGHRQFTIRDLIAIGRELGISPSDIREVVHQVGGSIQDAAHHMGHRFYDKFVAYVKDLNYQLSPHNLGYGQTSLSNLQAEEQAPMKRHHGGDPIAATHGHEAHNMGKTAEEGGEQQVTKPHHIWRRFPNTQTTALKWVMTLFGSGTSDYTGYLIPFDRQDITTATSLSTTGGGAWTGTTKNTLAGTSLFANAVDLDAPQLFQVRMTCPYNILKQAYSNAITATNHSQPTWLQYFDQMYQYYHTMETEWELNFHFGIPITADNTSATNYQNMGVWIFWKYTCQDDPPLSWSNKVGTVLADARQTNSTNNAAPTPDQTTTTALTDTGATVNLTADDYFRMGGWHHKYVQFSTIHATHARIEGSYKFGQSKMDIKTIQPSDAHSADTTAEGWTQSNATPAFPELLSVIVVYDNATYNSTSSTIKTPMSVRFETEQLVQWKDLRPNYKFPTPELANPLQTSGISTTTEYNFMRGAVYT